MRIQGTFLGTKVARRMLLLFILCGLVPSGLAILYAFTSVRSELRRHAQERLRNEAKIAAAATMDHFRLLDRELADLAAGLADSHESDTPTVTGNEAGRGFRTVAIQPLGRSRQSAGESGPMPELTPQARRHLESSKPLLIVREEGVDARLFLARAVDLPDPNGSLIWGELDSHLLWESVSGSARSALATELCILGEAGKPLFCTLRDPEAAGSQLRRRAGNSGPAFFEFDDAGEPQLAAAWTMFLGFEFGAEDWAIISSEPLAPVLAPLDKFRRYLTLILTLAVSTVFFLANIQIRRTTEPLELLEAATHRVADGDLVASVQVDSGDEFGNLANSFNVMTRRLHDQFATLAAMTDVDRAVLSSLDLEEIVHTVLLNAQKVTGGQGAGLMLLDADGGSVDAFVMAGGTDRVTKIYDHPIAVEDFTALGERPEGLTIDVADSARERAGLVNLEPLLFAELRRFRVYPLLEEQTLYGVLLIGCRGSEPGDPDARLRARQLADQVSVALSNARLVRELSELSDGTIMALSRTIDAKSTWTAGHSYRVTHMALALGDRLGLTAAERITLHRGGLLHDIGKIGIPPGILDKPGPLTEEEMNAMRQHTVIGATILEPIKALAGIVPIALHHHERFDGEGYPHGLAGEDIPRLARILAVADVFDALVSDRPYRSALPLDTAFEIIERGAGTQFDPDVVRVFMELAAAGEIGDLGFQVPLSAAAS